MHTDVLSFVFDLFKKNKEILVYYLHLYIFSNINNKMLFYFDSYNADFLSTQWVLITGLVFIPFWFTGRVHIG